MRHHAQLALELRRLGALHTRADAAEAERAQGCNLVRWAPVGGSDLPDPNSAHGAASSGGSAVDASSPLASGSVATATGSGDSVPLPAAAAASSFWLIPSTSLTLRPRSS